MRKVVLITGIGGDIAQGVAIILREKRPDLLLIGVDIHTRHGGHLLVDHFFQIPKANVPDYLDTIKNIVREHSVDMIIPMSEPELAITRPFPELISGIKWITAGDHVVKVGLDKLETMHAISELDIPVCWTLPVSVGRPISYPCIFKSRSGSGSQAVFTVYDDEDVDYLIKRYPDAIFQELLEPADREITCAVYRRRDGEVASLLMLRHLASGLTGWVKVIKNKEITKMCGAIAHGLNLRGSMNIQLRLTNNGPRVFEINPRFSSTVLMRQRIGFTDVLWSIDEAEGKSINFPEIPEDSIMVSVRNAVISC